jgi:hypothetical protein
VLTQGLAHELVNAKLITLSDVGGATSAGFEAYISLIRAKVDARGLRCHASDLHPNSSSSQVRFKETIPISRSYDLFYEGP